MHRDKMSHMDAQTRAIRELNKSVQHLLRVSQALNTNLVQIGQLLKQQTPVTEEETPPNAG